jgi:hypothetical protein
MTLDLPVHADGNIHFRATLIALMNRLMGTDLPGHLEVVRGLQRQLTRSENLARRPRAYAALKHTPSFIARHSKDKEKVNLAIANAVNNIAAAADIPGTAATTTHGHGSMATIASAPVGGSTATVAPAPTPSNDRSQQPPAGVLVHQGSNHDLASVNAAPLPQRKRGSFAVRFYTPFEVTFVPLIEWVNH